MGSLTEDGNWGATRSSREGCSADRLALLHTALYVQGIEITPNNGKGLVKVNKQVWDLVRLPNAAQMFGFRRGG